MRRKTRAVVADDELWEPIESFPRYQVSSRGEIINLDSGRPVRTSTTNHGDVKVKLWRDGESFTRSVKVLVAKAFVEKPDVDIRLSGPCSSVIVLDGDPQNLNAWNLAWRPKHFAWKYTHQLRVSQPNRYHSLAVENLKTGKAYPNVVEAGMTEGLLFDDIWRSTYMETECFPNRSTWIVVERV